MTLAPRFRNAVHVSPTRSAVETAGVMALPIQAEPALADAGHGAWAGRTFEDVAANAPDQLAAWLADPTMAAPGGEAMDAVRARAAPWLDRLASADAPVCAITHATIVRAVLAHALDLPLRATLAIDIAPLSRTMLSFNRGWRLQSIGPVD